MTALIINREAQSYKRMKTALAILLLASWAVTAKKADEVHYHYHLGSDVEFKSDRKLDQACTNTANKNYNDCILDAYGASSEEEWNQKSGACKTQWKDELSKCGRRLANEGRKLDLCETGAATKKALCNTGAAFTFDKRKKAFKQNACLRDYNIAIRQCRQKKLEEQHERVLLNGTKAERHRSWCTFKAGSKKHWCKLGASFTWNKAKREAKKRACDLAYNSSVLACNRAKAVSTNAAVVVKH